MHLKDCDLVMKGGIASGTVYPKVITELAQDYRFVNIGGTSAGAIAAGLAAAAEYQRRQGSNAGFVLLDQLSDEIGHCLLSLFQPTAIHKKLFHAIVGLMKQKKKPLIRFFLFNLFRIVKSFKALPNTYFGICTGMTVGTNSEPGLTDWLNNWLEKSAGRLQADGSLPETPLTFGLLKREGITLRTISTNLSEQLPVNLPNMKFALAKKQDLDALLPENVVAYIGSQQELLQASLENKDIGDEFWIIPTEDDMPVLLAIRLSLSVPVLLSSFPLYRYDWSLRLNSEQQKIPQVCWFSDGGISINFPIHLFDHIFPSRPTFGISLDKFDPCRHEPDSDNGDNTNRIYLPTSARQGMTVPIRAIKNWFEFLTSTFSVAQNWQDNAQMVLPGYRERIVRVALKPEEGGFNLTMTAPQIKKLTTIGADAGKEICTKFNFDEHRWRRLLSAYAAIEDMLEELATEYYNSDPESMNEFLTRYRETYQAGTPIANSYKPEKINEFDELESRIDSLMTLAKVMMQKPIRDKWGAGKMPRPAANLKLTPERFAK